MKKWYLFAILLIAIGLIGGAIYTLIVTTTDLEVTTSFNAQRSYQDLLNQTDLGARVPGSQSHEQVVLYLQSELSKANWDIELQQVRYQNHDVKNIIARRGNGTPLIILGAHYDSRLAADRDQDPGKRDQPVPGANDGASGVAVLLELSRTLPTDIQGQVWLVFFDLEDQGGLPGYDWILGSRAFVEQLDQRPDAVVILDMIGDADLKVYQEINSTPSLREEIWSAAKQLSYENTFISQEKHSLLDDHTPFLELGIPAVVLIDFDYPHWHTSQDTTDKVSVNSLRIIGETILEWILPIVTVGKK